MFAELKPRSFGRSSDGPFELEVLLETKPINILNVGYGVSQSIPIIVEAINQPRGTAFVIQQPEVHLHPRAQAGIGALLYDLAVHEQKRFLVETHSDYLIDRFRLSYRSRGAKPKAQVLFFQRKAGQNLASSIPISDDGSISDLQPSEYRDFFVKEQLKVLGLE